jgi:hypothetical protein
MDKITFGNKVDTKVTSVAEINKVTGTNLNEIKSVTNLAVEQILNNKEDITSLINGNGKIYVSVSNAMAVLPLPSDNTPFTVRDSVSNLEDGYYIYLSTEVGGYKFLQALQALANGYYVINSLLDFDSLISNASSGVWMVISDITLDANKTIPSGVTLQFRNAKINLGGFTLTGTKTRIDAVLTQIFDNSGDLDGDYDIKEVYPQWFGAVGDGNTNDTLALSFTIDICNSLNKKLEINGNYFINTTSEPNSLLLLPGKVSGAFNLIGDNAVVGWDQIKEVVQSGKMKCEKVIISDLWYSSLENIVARGDFEIKGVDPAWGTFWNTFKFIRCSLFLINTDTGQSVNQNTFENVRCSGGLKITGVNTTGVRECHNNTFLNLDTTGANITNLIGETGIHVLNESKLNQTNNIITWYAESSGNRRIVGNFNVLGSNVDSSTGVYQIQRSNSSIFSGGTGRNNGFLASSNKNSCRGGDYIELSGTGRPLGLSSNGIAEIISTTDSPDGNQIAFKVTANGTYNNITFNYKLGSNDKVSLCAFIKKDNNVSFSVEAYRGSGNISSSPTFVDVGNGWFLMRISASTGFVGDGNSGENGFLRVFITTSSLPSPSPILTIGSFFLTTENICPLPYFSNGFKNGYASSVPTLGIWSIGDFVNNTSPSVDVNNNILKGWIRLTNGSSNVNNTDWKAIYISTTSV